MPSLKGVFGEKKVKGPSKAKLSEKEIIRQQLKMQRQAPSDPPPLYTYEDPQNSHQASSYTRNPQSLQQIQRRMSFDGFPQRPQESGYVIGEVYDDHDDRGRQQRAAPRPSARPGMSTHAGPGGVPQRSRSIAPRLDQSTRDRRGAPYSGNEVARYNSRPEYPQATSTHAGPSSAPQHEYAQQGQPVRRQMHSPRDMAQYIARDAYEQGYDRQQLMMQVERNHQQMQMEHQRQMDRVQNELERMKIKNELDSMKQYQQAIKEELLKTSLELKFHKETTKMQLEHQQQMTKAALARAEKAEAKASKNKDKVANKPITIQNTVHGAQSTQNQESRHGGHGGYWPCYYGWGGRYYWY